MGSILNNLKSRLENRVSEKVKSATNRITMTGGGGQRVASDTVQSPLQ